MYSNLDAEQARKGHSNAFVADMMGISRVSFENKKKTGKFTAKECKKLCTFYNSTFEYLFYTNENELIGA